jgi:hypothetical protein
MLRLQRHAETGSGIAVFAPRASRDLGSIAFGAYAQRGTDDRIYATFALGS